MKPHIITVANRKGGDAANSMAYAVINGEDAKDFAQR